jgi:hypothetical protein
VSIFDARKWAVGQTIAVDTSDGVEKNVTILGPAESGNRDEMHIRFSDGTTGDCRTSDFIDLGGGQQRYDRHPRLGSPQEQRRSREREHAFSLKIPGDFKQLQPDEKLGDKKRNETDRVHEYEEKVKAAFKKHPELQKHAHNIKGMKVQNCWDNPGKYIIVDVFFQDIKTKGAAEKMVNAILRDSDENDSLMVPALSDEHEGATVCVEKGKFRPQTEFSPNFKSLTQSTLEYRVPEDDYLQLRVMLHEGNEIGVRIIESLNPDQWNTAVGNGEKRCFCNAACSLPVSCSDPASLLAQTTPPPSYACTRYFPEEVTGRRWSHNHHSQIHPAETLTAQLLEFLRLLLLRRQEQQAQRPLEKQ